MNDLFRGKVFALSGEFKATQQVLRQRIHALHGHTNITQNLKKCTHMVIGNRASLRDIQVCRERAMVMLTESQLLYWMQTGEPPRVLSMEEAINTTKGMEYDFVWGHKPDEFGAF